MFSKGISENDISVIIPAFNRAAYLYVTLICLCNQDVNNSYDYEIIIVDSRDDNTNTMLKYRKEVKQMLALQESSEFEVMNQDELYHINGGSGSGFSVSTSGSYTSPLTWSAGVDVTVSTKNGTFSVETVSDTSGTISASGHILYTSSSSSSSLSGS
jgi:glycosyltransferase involved in cell wall biosynthesis